MGMNIQKSAGVKADTFILKRNNMDRRIRMDVAMLIILAICTRLVAGIMNVEKMDAYTGSGEGFCKAVSESHGVDMVKDCFELGTQKVLDVKKTAKSVCKSVTIKKTMQDVIRPTETEEIIPEVKGVPEAKDGKAAWASMDSVKTETITQETETITQETVTDKSVPESITGKITGEPAGEPMTEDLLNLEGFKVNSEGVIEGYENLDLILCDGMIIFPADERCSGIGEHALDGIPDAVEVYIPANITFVAPGVLEKIGGFMYIEVAPDNPVYESRDGMLYNKGGELISRPNGR